MSCSAVWTAAALLLVLLAGTRALAAQPGGVAPAVEVSGPPRIVLSASDSAGPLLSRVAAELRSLRFEVVIVPVETAAPSATQLEALARSLEARAAVQVSVLGDSMDLWLVNPETHEVVYRRIASDSDPAVAAFRLLEILRGSLIDLRALAPTAGPKPVEKPAPRAKPALLPPSERTRTFSFSLGAAVARPGSEATPAWYGLASFRALFGAHVALNGFALAPVSSSRIEGDGGYARVFGGLLGGSVSFQPWRERILTPSLGAGAAGVVLHTRGVPSPGFSGSTQLDLAAYPHARADVSARLSRLVRMRAELLGGAVVPRPVLLFADREVGIWGSSLLIASLGIELILP